MSERQAVLRKAIPLCGIVLVLGITGYSTMIYSPPANGASRLPAAAQANPKSADESKEIITMIQKFLADVPANKRETYDRFFADDVIYTRNSGQVVTKKDILADADNPAAPRANAAFTGEEFTVHQYGDTAIVNFRLVMHGTDNGAAMTRSFRNTGTFMKRNGRWQVIAWQATPIAESQNRSQ